MSGFDSRKLNIEASATGTESHNAVFEKLKAIGSQAKITAKDLTTYEQAFKLGILTHQEYAAAQEAVIRNEKRAADELQRWGRMQESAILIDRQRTKSINDQAAAQEKLSRTQGLAGLRGTAGIGQLAGVLPGGSSTAIYGVSSLLNAGLSTTTALAGGAALAIGALGIATFKAANSLGEYARQQQNLAERTGLTTQQTQQFSRAAELVGVNGGTLTTTMRTLSKALSDNSEEGKKAKEALAELGIGGTDQLLPMGEMLKLIARRLSGLSDGAEKDRIAIALLGRSGLELLPLFSNFDKLNAAVRESGVVIDEEGIKKAAAYELEIKTLELRWVALVDAFKEKAVGVVEFVLHTDQALRGIPNPFGLAKRAAEAAGFGLFGDGGKIIYDLPDVAPPKAPGAAPGSAVDPAADPSMLRSQMRESELLGIRQQFQTPKERINEEIKRRREELTLAEGSFKTARAGAPLEKAEADVRDRARRLQLAEQQRDALKGGGKNPALEETLRLQELLIRDQEKELTGEAKIDAEYQKQLLHLREKTGSKGQSLDTPENRAVAAQIRDAGYDIVHQQQRIAATDSQRSVDDATLRAGQERVRGTSSRRSQLALQALSQSGDEAGGIKAREGQEVADAKLELEFARQKAAVDIDRAEKDHALRGDDIKYNAELTAVITARTAAESAAETKISNARLQTAIALISLRQKDRKEAEETAKQQIESRRAESDILASRNRTIAEGQSRLGVVNAAPGFQLQAELNADAKRLQRDRAQAALNQVRIVEDTNVLKNEQTGDLARKAQIARDIEHLRVEGLKEAAKLEDDIIKTRYDAEVRIAEERKSREQAFRSTVTGFVSAAQQGKGQEYLKGIGQNILGTITGNVAGLAFPAVDKQTAGISQRISGTASDPTFIGKLLAGTPLGPRENNPIAATSANTTATVANTAAIQALTATQTAIVTGQPLPSGATPTGGSIAGIPGIGTFGSDTTGITGQGGFGTDIYGNNLPNPNAANQESVRAALGLGGGSTASSVSYGGIGGLTGGLAHTGDLAGIFTGGTSGPNGAESLSTTERTGAAIGTAGVVYAGVSSALKDFGKGGARGITAGIGDIAGTAAALDPEPISKAVLAGVALGSKVVSALLGDPRANRQKQETRELSEGVYQSPLAQNRTQDIFGNYTDSDKYGKVQTSNLSAIPQITSPYITLRNGTYYDVAGQITSPFGGASSAPNAPGPPANPIERERAGFSQQNQATPVVQIHFNSLDPSSAMDYFKSNPQVANSVIHFGLTQATGPAQGAVRSVVGLR